MSETEQPPRRAQAPALPPAVVAVVTEGVTSPKGARVTLNVLRHTLAGLAGAGWFRFEQQDSTTPMLRITRRLTYENIPKRSEHLVLQRIGHRAGGQPDVPLSAILSSEGTDWNLWWARYVTAVMDEAEAAGLIRRLIHFPGAYVVMAACAVVSGALTVHAGKGIGITLLVALLAGLFPGVVLAKWLLTQMITRAGRTVARQEMDGGPAGGPAPAADHHQPQPPPHSGRRRRGSRGDPTLRRSGLVVLRRPLAHGHGPGRRGPLAHSPEHRRRSRAGSGAGGQAVGSDPCHRRAGDDVGLLLLLYR